MFLKTEDMGHVNVSRIVRIDPAVKLWLVHFIDEQGEPATAHAKPSECTRVLDALS
jgi:ABC-type transporter Mla MlaB component